MFTIDASVHVSALNPHEAESETSVRFLQFVQEEAILVFSPVLLVIEVAAAVTRTLGDPSRALQLARALRDLPRQTLVPLDDQILDQAIDFATAARLRGADAVYAAVAQHYGTTLVTLDRQQLERLSPRLNTRRPADLLPNSQQ